jgi:hypothetical protein
MGADQRQCRARSVRVLRSKEAKERLRPTLAPLNVEKTMTAPVTVIVAYDLKFYEQLPKLFPQNPGMAKLVERNLGYGDQGTLHPRLPRLPFTEACSLL